MAMWIKASLIFAGLLINSVALRFPAMRLSRSSSSALKAISTDSAVENAQITDMPPLEELQRILSVAERAARKAGDLIRENIGARVKYSKTNYKVCVEPCVLRMPPGHSQLILIIFFVLLY
jgi:hypothetical protein